MAFPELKRSLHRLGWCLLAGLLSACGGGGADAGITPGLSGTGTGAAALPGPGAGTTGATGTTGTPAAVAGATAFSVLLSGAQALPPNASIATGNAIMTVDTSTGDFTISLTVVGMAATAAHIHDAVAGINGPVLFSLIQTTPGGNAWLAGGRMTVSQLRQLNAGGYYIDVHSQAFPNGEIRAQLLPSRPLPVGTTGATGTTGTTDTTGTTGLTGV
jgi:hypothetical protein